MRPMAALDPGQAEHLLAAARAVLDRAYAPYSGFRVGAAVLTGSDHVYAGCNVESSSYGLTCCAERAAIFAAVAAEGPHVVVAAVAVTSSREGPCSPCGACRQVIAEFGPDAMVLYPGTEGTVARPIAELLPDTFMLP
jgi:cytidine deaminase